MTFNSLPFCLFLLCASVSLGRLTTFIVSISMVTSDRVDLIAKIVNDLRVSAASGLVGSNLRRDVFVVVRSMERAVDQNIATDLVPVARIVRVLVELSFARSSGGTSHLRQLVQATYSLLSLEYKQDLILGGTGGKRSWLHQRAAMHLLVPYLWLHNTSWHNTLRNFLQTTRYGVWPICHDLDEAPTNTLYLLWSPWENLIYIGKTGNFRQRYLQHRWALIKGDERELLPGHRVIRNLETSDLNSVVGNIARFFFQPFAIIPGSQVDLARIREKDKTAGS